MKTKINISKGGKAIKAAAPAKKAEKTEKEYAPPALEEYEGHPMINLSPDARFPFRFGLGKAKMIVKHFKVIEKFLASEGKSLK